MEFQTILKRIPMLTTFSIQTDEKKIPSLLSMKIPIRVKFQSIEKNQMKIFPYSLLF